MSSREWQRTLKRVRHATNQVAPDSAWTNKMRETLLMQAADSLSRERVSTSETARAFFQQFVPARFVEAMRGPALAVLSIIGFIAGGSIASVSAAEQSIPGDFLYPLKIVREQASIMLAKSKTDKLKLKTEFVGRRVEEMKTIAASNSPKKEERLKESVEVLKRDVNTVKEQLADANDGTIKEVAQAAHLVDQQTSQVVTALQDVKPSLSAESQETATEVQAVAVNTSVKAIQVLLENHANPEVSEVISSEDLFKSVQVKVEGIEQSLTDATQKLVTQGLATTSSTTGTIMLVTTSTSMTATGTVKLIDLNAASSSVEQINSAKQVLVQTRQLIQEQKLDEVKDKLNEVVKASEKIDSSLAIVQQQGIAANAISNGTTTPATVQTPSSTTGTVMTSSTPATLDLTTSTPPVTPATSTTSTVK